MSNPNLSTILIGVTVFIFIITAGVFYIGSIGYNYGTSSAMTTQFNKSFSKVAEMENISGQMQGAIQQTGSSSDLGIIGVTGVLMNAAFSFFRSIPVSIGFIFSMFGDAAVFFNLPPFVIWAPIMILTIIILASIISIVFFREV